MATDPPSRRSMHHVIHIPYDPPKTHGPHDPPPPPPITAEEIYTKILKDFLIWEHRYHENVQFSQRRSVHFTLGWYSFQLAEKLQDLTWDEKA